MAQPEVDELMVYLEKSMDLSIMEHGIKLVGAALVNITLNKQGVRNILLFAWKKKWASLKSNGFETTPSS